MNGKSGSLDPQVIHQQPPMFPARFARTQIPFPTVRTGSKEEVHRSAIDQNLFREERATRRRSSLGQAGVDNLEG
jgi:hypothetical protein